MEQKKSKSNIKTVFPFISLIIILLLFTILTRGKLWSLASLKAILNDGLYVMMGTIGFTILCSMGMLDFSIGYNMGVCCAVCCLAAKAFGIWASFPAAVLMGMLIVTMNGFIVTKTKIDSMIATIGVMFILQGLVLVILNGSVLQAPLGILKLYTNPLKITLMLVSVIAGFLYLEKTKYGRISKAIGSCPEAVRQTGIHADTYRIVAYVIMGGICGVLGFLSLARTGSATSSTGSSLMFNCLNATLLGSVPLTGGPTTKFRGALIGTLTISFLVSGMTLLRIGSQEQQLIKGIIFLIAVGVCFDRKNTKVIK